MMESFDSLIHASAARLTEVLVPLGGRVQGDGGERRAQLARLLGVNVAQLVCGVGFNAGAQHLAGLPQWLGFASREGLLVERNYLFIHDRYQALGVSNIVEIYAALGATETPAGAV